MCAQERREKGSASSLPGANTGGGDGLKQQRRCGYVVREARPLAEKTLDAGKPVGTDPDADKSLIPESIGPESIDAVSIGAERTGAGSISAESIGADKTPPSKRAGDMFRCSLSFRVDRHLPHS